MFSFFHSAICSSVAKVAVLAVVGVSLAACGEMYSRGDFEALVKYKSEEEVSAKIGKPSDIDRSKPDQVRWTYTSRTFSIENANKRDTRTIVIFGRASDGALRAADVVFE